MAKAGRMNYKGIRVGHPSWYFKNKIKKINKTTKKRKIRRAKRRYKKEDLSSVLKCLVRIKTTKLILYTRKN